ncbi:hypothetical protein [Burkholderia ambifaria]|uniref:hypothetical protein n=1 Tax=Burkholderia ambifaria TaxID=152480 RepID=UPI00158EA576|nr:hypothetical protein [Burkholderia ambifaria]
MKKSMKKIGMIRRWRGCLLGACLMVLSCNAFASKSIVYTNVVSSYGSCLWRNNGDGTSTIQVVINFRTITGNLGGTNGWGPDPDDRFVSRGVLVYTYDANGRMRPSTDVAKYVAMNGTKSTWAVLGVGGGYVMYAGMDNWVARPGWDNKGPHTAIVEILIDNAVIKDWPGVSIRGGNFTVMSYDVAEITGGVYVTPVSGGSACKVIDPEVPPPDPPVVLTVDVAAPDWNLGELQRGDGEKTLAGAEQQLCFTYTGFSGGSRNFVINATSANGVSGNRYLLRNASKPSQTVPYDLTLDSGSATFRLPNTSASPVQLNNGARTCFVPTFKTSVDATVDAGDYSDVLSFTVVTKS